MQLVNFRVKDFRSVSDSTPIDTKKVTAIVGRNESGKTNLLLALHSLNPADGIKALLPIKDFPRHRRLEECKDETVAVESTWELSDTEHELLGATWPRARSVKKVYVARDYKGRRTITFGKLPPLKYSAEEAGRLWGPIRDQLGRIAEDLAEPHNKAVTAAAAGLDKAVTAAGGGGKLKDQASAIHGAVPAVRTALAAAEQQLPDTDDSSLSALEKLSAEPADDEKQIAKARELITQRLPVFVYLDEYPDFEGHQDVSAYVTRKGQNQLTEADRNFEKLCKVAGLNPAQLHELFGRADHETRGQLANRAGAVVTAELRKLWKDRALKVRFGLDAQHLDTLAIQSCSASERGTMTQRLAGGPPKILCSSSAATQAFTPTLGTTPLGGSILQGCSAMRCWQSWLKLPIRPLVSQLVQARMLRHSRWGSVLGR